MPLIARPLLWLFLLLACAAPASAKDDWRICGRPGDKQFASCILRFTGSPSITGLRRQGAELVRIFLFFSDRVEYPVLIVEAASSPSGEAHLTLRDARAHNIHKSYDLSPAQFEELRNASQLFWGGDVTGPQQPDEETEVCLHPIEARVDFVLGGKTGAAYTDYCKPRGNAFINAIEELSASVAGDCASKGSDAYTLRGCIARGRSLTKQ